MPLGQELISSLLPSLFSTSQQEELVEDSTAPLSHVETVGTKCGFCSALLSFSLAPWLEEASILFS